MQLGSSSSSQSVLAPPRSGCRQRAADREILAARAVVFLGSAKVNVERLELTPPDEGDAIIDIDWSGISTGTERLMWSGEMPAFPGLSYPLVPGYEAVGRIVRAPSAPERVGETVFVPGARCFRSAAGLFGASASRLVVPAARAHSFSLKEPRQGVLFALAATAQHALAGGKAPDLIIGHGVFGRLLARLTLAEGGAAPVVWETNPRRRDAAAYPVIAPSDDTRTDYSCIYDASGDAAVIDKALAHLAPSGEIVLAGFYSARPSFAFPLAFRKEMRLRVAAEWTDADLRRVIALSGSGALPLDGLVTHTRSADRAADAYAEAFSDAGCLKMVLDWRHTDG